MHIVLIASLVEMFMMVVTIASHKGECWYVDSKVVHAGGCVTIIVEEPCSESWNLSLQIDQHAPVDLLREVGPKFHRRNSRLPGRDSTLVLLHRQLSNSDIFEEIPGRPGVFRAHPVFHEPGIVRLTVYDGEESLGSTELRVLPCPSEAEAALELINAPFTGKKNPTRESFLWSLLIAGETFSLSPPLTNRELELMREQLPTIMQHPDWKEIAEMRFAGIELRHYMDEVSEWPTPTTWRLRDDVPNPALPASVVEALKKKVASPYAEAVQDNVRDLAGQLNALIRQRQDER